MEAVEAVSGGVGEVSGRHLAVASLSALLSTQPIALVCSGPGPALVCSCSGLLLVWSGSALGPGREPAWKTNIGYM